MLFSRQTKKIGYYPEKSIPAMLYHSPIHLGSLYSHSRQDDASSYPIGVILLVAITCLLALLILLMIRIPLINLNMDREVPVIFAITSLESVDELTGHMNYDSRVLIRHTGMDHYQNKNLKAKFFKNAQPVTCTIATLNGHDFISTAHTGIQWMGGSGCSGMTWSPGEQICIDFSDGTFHPGDSIQMDIIDTVTNSTISRHHYKVV
jgi:hypothetical protein